MNSNTLTRPISKKPPTQTLCWLHSGASVIGKYHIENDIPCQDAHYIDTLQDNWQIAVVSDGAGSYENSQHGSKYIANNMASTMFKYLNRYKWFRKGSLPTQKNWRNISIQTLEDMRDQLKVFGEEQSFAFKSLGATVIVLIYSHKGCLTLHVGDGRSAILTKSDKWLAATIPFKGEQAGETVFLTEPLIWEFQEQCIFTSVIRRSIKAVVALSDGMENYAFKCLTPDEDNPGSWKDSNTPFSPFLNHNINAISLSYKNGNTRCEVEKGFSDFLFNGHPKIAMEGDDKTFVVSVLKS